MAVAEDHTQHPNITPYRRRPWLNIGTILFGAIFVYMVITVIIYLTADHISSYEVTAGTISGNYRYTALAIKTEEIIPADYSGYVTYYARNAARAGAGTTICSIDENPSTASSVTVSLSEEDYQDLNAEMASFSRNFSPSSFQSVYNFKADLEGYLLQASTQDEKHEGLLNQVASPASGFVSYTIDGMENITEADLSPQLFNRTGYETTNLRLNKQVRMGDDLYKLILGEDWVLYFQLGQQMAIRLADRSTVRFRFLKDDTTFSAGLSIIQSGNDYYGKITLHNSLVRYVTDRYLEIELLMDSEKGLKIPASSITTKTFWKIPEEYVIKNQDSEGEIVMQRESFNNDGSSKTEYVTATVYDRQDNCYLVSLDLFEPGDYVQLVNTAKKHQVVEEDRATIQGVFNINKGYAVFREVEVRDANEEFCIVKPYNAYGLAEHDFIVLDASSVQDDTIIHS